MSRKNRNWSEYNKKLINRGRITVWIDEDLAKNPFDPQKGRGRPRFSDSFLIAALTLRIVYSLSFRSLQGFMMDIFILLGIDKAVPHYSLYSKRIKTLKLPKLSNRRPVHILIDASGVKVVGEGEWKVKVHGTNRRRKWLKLHIAVDEKTQEVLVVKGTSSSVGDSKMAKALIEGCPRSVKRMTADGGYDGISVRKMLHDKGIEGIIPPPKNAKLRKERELKLRNEFISVQGGLGGDHKARALTKKLYNYHRRSLVETAFSRLKLLFGGRFRSRILKNMQVEAHLKFWILNRMAA